MYTAQKKCYIELIDLSLYLSNVFYKKMIALRTDTLKIYAVKCSFDVTVGRLTRSTYQSGDRRIEFRISLYYAIIYTAHIDDVHLADDR